MKEQTLDKKIQYETQQIDVTFTNDQNKKEEKYILFNEEKESLLIKEDNIKNKIGNYQPKISELFQSEDSEIYYLNKEKSKEKYLKNFFELDKKGEDISFNNKDKNEMDALYREISLMHPRKLINGEIQKYPFWTWTGCFTCKKIPKLEKNEFYSLGLGISSYFKTIKLLIFFFFIISCVNLVAVAHYLGYTSVITDNNFFFKTTLGNTKITTYNGIIYHFEENNYPPINLNCQEKAVGKFIYGLKLKEPSTVEETFNETELSFKGKNTERLSKDTLKYYNEKMVKECNLTNECELTFDNKLNEQNIKEDSNIHDYYLYYECIDLSLLPKNSSRNDLRGIMRTTSIITFVILIILFYYFREAINIDNKNYHKDKVVINNYTLVLKDLKKHNNDYFKELNDLINHLNNVIEKEIECNNASFAQDLKYIQNIQFNNYPEEVKPHNMNIFDISISTVNDEKMDIIEKIKSLKDDIEDLKEGNDTIKKKIKKKISNAIEEVTSLYKKIKSKNLDEDDVEDEDNNEPLMGNVNQEKIDKKKEKIKKQITKITKNQIQGLHMEGDKKKYVEIYITFRNPKIANYIYQIYNKNIFQRLLMFLFCNIKSIKLYYYKRQWLNFDLANNAPTNIMWENCYISTKKKWCHRGISLGITLFTIIISTILISIFTEAQDNTESIVNSYIIAGILEVIGIVSSSLLEKLTKFEKFSTLSKNVNSAIAKYFIMNYAVSTISVNIGNNYTYKNFDSQYSIIMSSLLQSMMFSIVTEHLSTLAYFLYNLFKRYLDSDYENGKKTKLKKKMEYEELYLGPEFPVGERLGGIFVNLGLCLLYGTSCPLIYLFFTLYLLTTFIVDKLLVIHYYKKPPYYDNYFILLTEKILLLSIIVYIYGTIYYISNPYLFNYYQNDSINFGFNEGYIYMLFNPFTIIFRIWGLFEKISIIIYNFSDLSYIYIYLLLIFIIPLIILKIYELFKKKEKSSLQNGPNIDIGIIYSLDELNKYYEVKKLELFKFLLNFDKNNSKNDIKKYSNLADNYKNVLDYLKQNIQYKKSLNNKNKETNNQKDENIINTDINTINKIESNEIIIKDNIENNKDRLLLGDPSYNLAFISDYEIFEYFDLLYYV